MFNSLAGQISDRAAKVQYLTAWRIRQGCKGSTFERLAGHWTGAENNGLASRSWANWKKLQNSEQV